ncbi:methyltransferase domain-containing protein [Brevibacterium daeguense]|uniref:Methyltransferase domain-containing protein n=1 Tax=Brevibacterium daeguense TaxID=909936 RepID=A0ABP8EIF7_9MICO|nr:methyltransferase domain-containing protein [Brevibacterium daeguense]
MRSSLPPALASVLDVLRCPNCAQRLEAVDRSLRCPAGHSFDVARQGYVSLLSGKRPTSGDDADMVRARDRFLATGIYAPIREALCGLSGSVAVARHGEESPDEAPAAQNSAMAPATASADPLTEVPTAGSAATASATIVDVGCGTGYYLAGVLDAVPGSRGLGLDSSTRALRLAARVHERAAAVTVDVFRTLPVADEAADVVLDVFAPRNPEEFHRILRPAGRLIVVRPAENHLGELRNRVPGMVGIDPTKEQRLQRALDPFFEVVSEQPIEYSRELTAGDALDLIGMTPSARHLGGDWRSEGGRPDVSGPVTVSVIASAYRPRRR